MDNIYIDFLKINLSKSVILHIKCFVYKSLNDDNFFDACSLWKNDKKECIIQFGHISYWNVINVTNMEAAFYDMYGFDDDISNWNVENVKNMSYMFFYSNHFYSNISKWDVSNLEDISYMFYNCKIFYSNLSKWKLSNNVKMQNIFYYYYHK